MFVADLENKLAARIREVNAYHLKPKLWRQHLRQDFGGRKKAGADLIVVGSHRPAMKDYLLGTNAAPVVRHATCSMLVART